MANEEYNRKKAQWTQLFDLIQDWVVACVKDANSIHIEDGIYCNQLRDDLIERLVTKEFDL
jgi:hypothetical protein